MSDLLDQWPHVATPGINYSEQDGEKAHIANSVISIPAETPTLERMHQNIYDNVWESDKETKCDDVVNKYLTACFETQARDNKDSAWFNQCNEIAQNSCGNRIRNFLHTWSSHKQQAKVNMMFANDMAFVTRKVLLEDLETMERICGTTLLKTLEYIHKNISSKDKQNAVYNAIRLRIIELERGKIAQFNCSKSTGCEFRDIAQGTSQVFSKFIDDPDFKEVDPMYRKTAQIFLFEEAPSYSTNKSIKSALDVINLGDTFFKNTTTQKVLKGVKGANAMYKKFGTPDVPSMDTIVKTVLQEVNSGCYNGDTDRILQTLTAVGKEDIFEKDPNKETVTNRANDLYSNLEGVDKPWFWDPTQPNTFELPWAKANDEAKILEQTYTDLKKNANDQTRFTKCFTGRLEDRDHLKLPLGADQDQVDRFLETFVITHGGIRRDIWINAVYTAVEEIRSTGFSKYFFDKYREVSDKDPDGDWKQCMQNAKGENWLYLSKASTLVSNLAKAGAAVSTLVGAVPVAAALGMVSAQSTMLSAAAAKKFTPSKYPQITSADNILKNVNKMHGDMTIQSTYNSKLGNNLPNELQITNLKQLNPCFQPPGANQYDTVAKWDEIIMARKGVTSPYHCKGQCANNSTYNKNGDKIIDKYPAGTFPLGGENPCLPCTPAYTCPANKRFSHACTPTSNYTCNTKK